MVWVIVVLAIVLLSLGAWAGAGRLGEMPPVVNDRPKGRIPDGQVDQRFLDGLVLPRASSGYAPSQVDSFLQGVAEGEHATAADVVFDVVAGGYDMQAVDAVLDRIPGAHQAAPVEEPPAEESEA
ncbi:hypothetical protein LKO27_08780 [Tessaracoccus sp. OS52]|uniref:hypothetical protein n=1 Tax=Tessaracoccus sp. OS52 TaxID=2886691 RepID=UPI001D10B4C6|nr:hypothetical protein [Tessaracoccus sp. OS52]MCC2593501.1 hypothetical protein [Tessaracoccus sp. OS52]